MIKISIITPIYNHGKEYLKECLNSLKNQTLREAEFILISDGAEESINKIIAEYAAADTRFIPIYLEKNMGIGAASNIGLKNAKGEYIGFLDSDDWLESDALDELYKIAKEQSAEVVKTGFFSFKKQKTYYENKFPKELINKILNVIPKEFILGHDSHWAGIYCAEFLRKNNIDFNENRNSVPDSGFTLKCFLYLKRLYISDKAYVHYRRDNVNSTIHAKAKQVDRLFSEHYYILNWLEKNKSSRYFYEAGAYKTFRMIVTNLFNRVWWRPSYFIKASKLLSAYKKHEMSQEIFNIAELNRLDFIINHPLLFFITHKITARSPDKSILEVLGVK